MYEICLLNDLNSGKVRRTFDKTLEAYNVITKLVKFSIDSA